MGQREVAFPVTAAHSQGGDQLSGFGLGLLSYQVCNFAVPRAVPIGGHEALAGVPDSGSHAVSCLIRRSLMPYHTQDPDQPEPLLVMAARSLV